MKTVDDVIRWLRAVEWTDEASRDGMLVAVKVLDEAVHTRRRIGRTNGPKPVDGATDAMDHIRYAVEHNDLVKLRVWLEQAASQESTVTCGYCDTPTHKTNHYCGACGSPLHAEGRPHSLDKLHRLQAAIDELRWVMPSRAFVNQEDRDAWNDVQAKLLVLSRTQ